MNKSVIKGIITGILINLFAWGFVQVIFPIVNAEATATLLPPPYSKFFYPAGTAFAGQALAGGQVFTYAAGTTTPLQSYTDSTALVANSNPIILDSSGQASIWIAGAYKVVIEDPNGNVLSTTDNVQDLFTYDNIQSTSTTSLAIQTGSPLTLTTQANKYYGPGVFVMIVNSANPTADYMHCPITSYIGTQLTCTPDGSLGSGTFASWTISLSGPLGPAGPTGPTGGSGGDMVGASNLLQGVGGVANVATARTNLGLGSAAVLNAGTGANQVIQLNSSSQIPAIDGSLLTNIYSYSNAANGYIIVGPIMMEWGTASNNVAVTFPRAFSNTPYSVQLTPNVNSSGGNCTTCTEVPYRAQSVTTTGFTPFVFGAPTTFWTAIGPT